MAKIQKLEVNTVEAVEIAIAAFRRTDSKIKQFTDGPSNTEDSKSLVYNYFLEGKKFPGCDAVDLREAAEQLINDIRGHITMSMLMSGRIPDFQKKICDLITADSVSSTNFGLLVWAPKVHADMQKASKVREETMVLGPTSRYLGQVGQKVMFKLTVISTRYLNMYNCWTHSGHDEHGNLVSFLNKAEIKSGKVSAKIKKTEPDKYNNNYNVTQLNYVKVME